MNIVLHQFPSSWTLPSPSPFCMKVSTFLRMVDLPYATADWSPTSAPLGKAPVVVLDGEPIADSTCIVRTLVERLRPDCDAAHTSAKLAKARGVQRMLEEHTYWSILAHRWLKDDIWSDYRFVIADGLPIPGPLVPLFTGYLRRNVRRDAHAHGLARHPDTEIERRAVEDVQTVAAVLGEQPYIAGDTPCSHDASVYTFLEHLAHETSAEPVRHAVRADPRLVAYIDRMRARCWPDWTFPA